MDNRKSLNYKIGFADSEILSYNSNNYSLFFYLQTWNGVILKIEFKEYIHFLDTVCIDVSDICENDSSSTLKKALENEFNEIPEDHGFKLYQFIDTNDEAAVEIVSKDVLITEVNNSSNWHEDSSLIGNT
ncbi:MAG: hypothetical protein BGO14_00915 [Chlamydiales bacterium 38-26]|nr:hypothetical protein [Chlamydiales bacterium]OJV07282.1 MAG: hypothetical protein BGO14_00915 [Chlamydiales bacterium 38-26]